MDSLNMQLSMLHKNNCVFFSLEGVNSVGKIVDVYDGDTITVILPLCHILFKDIFTEKDIVEKLKEVHRANFNEVSVLNKMFKAFKCRLAGIDTPEKRTRNKAEREWSENATRYLKGILHPSGIHHFHIHGADKYGRLLVDVYKYKDDVATINNQMIISGYAYAYDGRSRRRKFSDWFDVSKITNMFRRTR